MNARYTIRDVLYDDPQEVARLADLWNVLDADWPGGGLLHGAPLTSERMREQLRSRDLIVVLVAELAQELIGYIGVKQMPGRDDVAHGATVMVRPDWQGKGCGKALLLEALDRLTAKGFRQYRRTTWSGNLKAIPLYKKIGDFWKPGTSVELQNFIPTALTLPIAREFFERHTWHRCLRRDLTPAPDEIRWHGVRVFPYHFEVDDDLFMMVVDLQAEAATAIETNDVYVACYLGCEEIINGLSYTLTWEIVNKADDDRPLQVELAAEGIPSIDRCFARKFEVADSVKLQHPFVVSPGAEPAGAGAPQHAIVSRFLLNGMPVSLQTGFRVGQPIEIDVRGLQPTPAKSGEEVIVRLYNRLKIDVKGEVSFERRPGLAFDRWAEPFVLPATSWGICRFHLTADEGAHATSVRAVCTTGRDPGSGLSTQLETPAQPVTFRSVPIDRTYAWEAEDGGEVTVETPLFWVRINLRGGGFSVYERLSGLQVVQQEPPMIGPPFARQPDAPPCRPLIERLDGRVRVTLAIPSEAGLLIERTLTAGAGPYLRLEHKVSNPTGATLQPSLRCPGEIHLHREVTVPLAVGLIHETVEGLGDFPLPGDGDLPSDPAAYSEGWSARQEHGLVAGIVWKSCAAIDGVSVRLDLPAITPGSSVDGDPLHWVVARGDWEVVRNLWRRLWQPAGIREEQAPTAYPLLSAGFEPAPLLVAGECTRAWLCVRNRRLKPFAGDWALQVPGLRSEPAGGELSGVTPLCPERREVTVICPDPSPRIAPASLLLRSESTLDERDGPIVIVGDASRGVTVEVGAKYRVDNSWLSFSVAPGHHGSMVSLQYGGRELLASSFPEPRPYRWMTAWFGGVEPFLDQPGDVRHVRDSFTGEPVEHTGTRGLVWRGVRVTCQVRFPGTRWLVWSAEYLTTGGSNLVALLQRLANPSGATQEISAGFIVFPLMTSATRVHYDVPGRGCQAAALRERAPTHTNFRFGDAPWVAIETEGPLLTLISHPAPGEAGGWLDLEAAGLHTSSRFFLEPGEIKQRLSWLVLADSPRQAQAYQVLRTIADLP